MSKTPDGEKTEYGSIPYIAEAISRFRQSETAPVIIPFGSGHIHDTFLIKPRIQTPTDRALILQRINKTVFTEPEQLMENITGVTSFLQRKIAGSGGDPLRETLNYLPASDGKTYYRDPSGEYWRCCLFIENSVSYDKTSDPGIFCQSAIAFGRFQDLLSDYPAESLYEPIRGFHDTAARLESFRQAVSEDPFGKAAAAQNEIGFFLARSHLAAAFSGLVEDGKVKLRVTHNDTKLNNVLFDRISGKAICVIDLDTVMPGLAMTDFGDAVRHGANTAAEDEEDLSRVHLDLTLFEAFAKGFLQSCGNSLTEEEIRLLPLGTLVICYELGMRFLTDHLQGDVYFKTYRPDHNLIRAKAQIALLQDMETKQTEMDRILERLYSQL